MAMPPKHLELACETPVLVRGGLCITMLQAIPHTVVKLSIQCRQYVLHTRSASVAKYHRGQCTMAH
eukprot:6396030-Prymnesium_polylepis.1